jgi:hypothetical protein
LAYLDKHGLPGMTRSEISHLAVVVQTNLQVDSQRRALDNNGMRFLLSLKSFAISHRARSPPPTRPSSPDSQATKKNVAPSNRLPQMRWRDVLWGFHSESQEILVSACDEVCGKPMVWEDAKQFCLPLWLKSSEALVCLPHCEANQPILILEYSRRQPKWRSLLAMNLQKTMHAILLLARCTISL